MHHLSLSSSRPLSLRLQHSPGVTPGRRVFAWLVTSKCTLHALFVFSPLVAKSISFPFIAPPTSLCHYLSHASLLSYSFPFFFSPSIPFQVNPTRPNTSKACLPPSCSEAVIYLGGRAGGQAGSKPRPGTLRVGSRVAWKTCYTLSHTESVEKVKVHLGNCVILGGMYGQKLVKYILDIVRLQ